MATDERFGYYPYAGVNPNASMVYSTGISSGLSGYKVASGIQTSSYTPVTVYYCNISGSCYAMNEITGNSNSLYNASSGSINPNRQDVSNIYNIPGTSVSIRYMSLGNVASSFIPSDAFDLTPFTDLQSAAIAFLALFPDDYVNITYIGNGCTIGGLPYVETGTGVVVPVTLPIGASLTADNISVTKNGAAIDFTYNSQTKQIAFTAI